MKGKTTTGEWIREYLTKVKEDYIFSIWKQYKQEMKKGGYKYASYATFRRYVWILKKLGLIEFIRKEKSVHGKRILYKHYYKLNESKISSDMWYNPQAVIYSETRLGRKYLQGKLQENYRFQSCR